MKCFLIGMIPPKKKGLIELYAIPSKIGENCPSCEELVETGDLTNLMSYATDLKNVYSRHWDMSNIEVLDHTFANCTSLEYIDPSLWDTSSVYDLRGVFTNCSKLTYLSCKYWDTRKVVDMSNAFSNCSNLELLDLSNWDFSKVVTQESMFTNCSKLKKIIFKKGIRISSNVSKLFYGCKNLKEIDLYDSYVTSSHINSKDMFYKCSNLKTLIGGRKSLTVKIFQGLDDHIDLSQCPVLDRYSIRALFNGMFYITSDIEPDFSTKADTKTITLHSNAKDILLEEDIKVATDKGYEIVFMEDKTTI